MVRYRVIYNTDVKFGYKIQQSDIVESDVAISWKEIARRLNIDTDSIVDIVVIL